MEIISNAELINLLLVLAAAAAGAGFMAGLLGVGGGIVMVPLFITRLQFWISILLQECICQLEHLLQ